MYYLSVIIPCYNESENISVIFNKLSLFDNDVEIVFVDNGSTDNTAERISEKIAEINSSNIKCVSVTKNIGYGHGIMSGVSSASGEVLSWTHADLQTDPSDLLEAYKIYIAHPRYPHCILKGRRVGRNFFDAMFTAGMSLLSTLLLRVSLSDVNAQPKMFHRNFLKKLPNPPRDFSLDLYLLYQARIHKYPILEHQVHFGKRLYGESKGGGTLKGKLKLIQRTLKYMLKLTRELGP